jgi:hypothetical protein
MLLAGPDAPETLCGRNAMQPESFAAETHKRPEPEGSDRLKVLVFYL